MANEFFLYARKSTDSEERQVRSIEDQLSELRLLAKKENIIIKEEFTESMTAKVPGRPIFNEMISRIEKGEVQGIIAWHPDRLARNSVDGGRIIYLLDTKHLLYLKFSTFWFESTPQGKFMLNIAFGQSKYYVDNLSENIKRGIRQKLKRGEWPGALPVGYLLDPNLRKAVIDPVKGPKVRQLFELYATGKYTVADLKVKAGELNLVSRRGKALVHHGVYHTLTNSFYYGLMRYHGEVYQGCHFSLISKELFDRVQTLLHLRNQPKKKRKHLFPFLGLATCASCGCSITAERQKGHHYYRCTKKREKCSEPFLREEYLAIQIKKAISKVVLPTDLFQKIMAEWAKEKSEVTQPVANLKKTIVTEIPALTSKIDKLLDAHLEGLIDKVEFQSKKESLLKRKIDLEEKLIKLEQGTTGWLEPCKKFLEAAHHAGLLANEENLEAQKNFLKKIGSNFTVAAKTLHFSYNFPWALLAKSDTFSNMWSRGGSNP